MNAARTVVACFGEALVDLLAAPGATPGQPRSFVEYAGGAPANVAVGVARLGGRARFIGMLGQDMFGAFLRDALVRHGVDISQVRSTHAARTALAFVALDAGGERSFSFYRPPSADLLFGVGDFAAEAFDDVAVLHACSNSMTAPGCAAATVHAMERAADAGALVSMDLNLRPMLWDAGADPRPTVWQALERAHLVKLSGEELAFLRGDGGEDVVLSRLFAAHARAVVVTDGAAPIRWWTRAHAGTAPTFAVRPLDTTAAGDAFVAGVLHALVQARIGAATLAAVFEDDARRTPVLARGAAAGALATMRHGAFAAMPALDAVDALIGACR